MTTLRQKYLTKPIHRWARGALPRLSKTESEALSAGDVWWEAELFSGNPDWSKLSEVAMGLGGGSAPPVEAAPSGGVEHISLLQPLQTEVLPAGDPELPADPEAAAVEQLGNDPGAHATHAPLSHRVRLPGFEC